ncbi:MAG: sigma-70 family RNA polymerase sigma factor [Armatimonadota bacterium]|nr:sigma-70 family RNA polymerase sigma factor [Armatimonadota bacterium]
MTDTASTWDGLERRGPSRQDDEIRAHKLLMQYRAGGSGAQAAREALVTQFRPLVQKQARQFLTPSVPLEDLVQEGMLGLMHAIEQFDTTRGVKLITYATHHIDGHLRHFLRDRVQIIKEPAWLQEMAQKVRRETEALTQELKREPTDAEVAGSLGLKETEVTRIRTTRATFAVSSLDEAQENGGAAAHVQTTQDTSLAELPIEEKVVLESALLRLKEIEQKVLYSFYYEDRSQTDIARALGVSNNYISHILKNSARKLQQMFRSDAVREAALQHESRRRRLASGAYLGDEPDDASPTVVDPVTGLYTRGYFEARLDEELSRAKRHNLELSVIRLEVGEDLPEAALFAQVAQTVKDCMRRSDLVARADTREIAALLPHTGATRETVRQRLLDRLGALCSSLPHACTLTLGVASYPAHRQRQSLLQAATPQERV